MVRVHVSRNHVIVYALIFELGFVQNNGTSSSNICVPLYEQNMRSCFFFNVANKQVTKLQNCTTSTKSYAVNVVIGRPEMHKIQSMLVHQ